MRSDRAQQFCTSLRKALPVRMALCSLSPPTNRRLISHSWTPPHIGCSLTHVHLQPLCSHLETTFKTWTKRGGHQNAFFFGISVNLSNTLNAHGWGSQDQIGKILQHQHAGGCQLECLHILRKNPTAVIRTFKSKSLTRTNTGVINQTYISNFLWLNIYRILISHLIPHWENLEQTKHTQ